MSARHNAFVGCAGWGLNASNRQAFPDQGSHLQRYAAVFSAVEINSSFYRPHRPQTYTRWAESVPPGFRFSVKVPQEITHVRRLSGCEGLLDAFLSECTHLGDRLGCLLVQLPPSLAFDPVVVAAFFAVLRARHSGAVVIEPRHASWSDAQRMLVEYRIAQVCADPSRIGTDSVPSGWLGMRYWRLHGAPRMYYSGYSPERLQEMARAYLTSLNAGVPSWCVFDNTAAGAAVADALEMQVLLGEAADLRW